MSMDNDTTDRNDPLDLDEILAEFGRKSQEPRKSAPPSSSGRPDNTIPFPTRSHRPSRPEASMTGEPPKGNYISAQGEPDSVDALADEGADRDDPVDEPTRILQFPAPEPGNPLTRLSRKADEFAAHMYEQEKLDDPRICRAEKLIPGVDEEEPPQKRPGTAPEQRLRKEPPPPPDVPPAELARRYAKGLSVLRVRTLLVFLLAGAALCLTLARDFGLPPLMTDPALTVYTIAGLHVIALVLGYDALARALTRPFMGEGLGMDAMTVLSNLFTLADALTIPSLGVGSVRQPFCGVAALGLGCVMLGNLQKQRGQRFCCRTAASAASPWLVTRDAAKWNGRDAYVKWSGPIAGFGSQVQSPDGAQRIYRFLSPILLTAAVLFALISSLGQGRAADLLWCLAALLTAAAPLSATLCFGSPWRRLALRLSRSGAALAGWPGVANAGGASNLLLFDADLFPGKAVTVNGVKIFGDFPTDMVVADTATVIRDAGSGLEDVFYGLLRSQGTFYRTGEELTAYEGGGLSEVIRGRQVLVGSAAFMVLMDVSLPSGLKVKNAVFCAIDGELAGIFALNYQLPGAAPEAIDSLIRNRITPVLATRDFNLIPSMLAQRFKLPVEKMEFPSVERRRELSDPEREHADTLSAVLCREGLAPYAEAAVGARRLRTAVRLSASLACLSSGIGILLAFYLTFVAAYASLTPLHLLVFVLVWLAPAALISGWVNRY